MNYETMGRIAQFLQTLPAVKTYGFKIINVEYQIQMPISPIFVTVQYKDRITKVKISPALIAKVDRTGMSTEFNRALENVPNVAMQQINLGMPFCDSVPVKKEEEFYQDPDCWPGCDEPDYPEER
jgi:hypothetical protein